MCARSESSPLLMVPEPPRDLTRMDPLNMDNGYGSISTDDRTDRNGSSVTLFAFVIRCVAIALLILTVVFPILPQDLITKVPLDALCLILCLVYLVLLCFGTRETTEFVVVVYFEKLSKQIAQVMTRLDDLRHQSVEQHRQVQNDITGMLNDLSQQIDHLTERYMCALNKIERMFGTMAEAISLLRHARNESDTHLRVSLAETNRAIAALRVETQAHLDETNRAIASVRVETNSHLDVLFHEIRQGRRYSW